jgi:uncharacterized DUF497 family protein
MFFNQPIVVTEDSVHSKPEERLYALGRTDADRLLFAVFTVRQNSYNIGKRHEQQGKKGI